MEVTLRDEFFKASSDNKILTMRPADLLVALKQLGLRTKLGNTRVPLTATLDGHGGMTAEQVLLSLRRQFDNYTRPLDTPAQRRLRYFFQFQLMPFDTRQLMSNYMALTMLPGQHMKTFPSNTRFWDIDKLEILALGTRLHRMVQRDGSSPFFIDHFDTKVLMTEVDRADGVIKLGGIGHEISIDEETKETIITPYQRIGLSRMMDFEPGRDPWSVPRDCPEIIDQAIELHSALEYGFAVGTNDQQEPVLPPLMLGFEKSDDVDLEETPQLRFRAFCHVVDWLRLGKPVSGMFSWAKEILPDFDCVDPDNLTSWNIIEGRLRQKAGYVLGSAWEFNTINHDGLYLVPAELFNPDSEQKPFDVAIRIFADLSQHLGRTTVWPNGREIVDQNLGRIQLIRLAVPETMPKGKNGLWEYDFQTTEPGMEKEFV